jgi:hypothetical protein
VTRGGGRCVGLTGVGERNMVGEEMRYCGYLDGWDPVLSTSACLCMIVFFDVVLDINTQMTSYSGCEY